jgi:TatD DNase family protein
MTAEAVPAAPGASRAQGTHGTDAGRGTHGPHAMHAAVIEWFDSHCHLQEEFTAEGVERGAHATELAGTLARASEAGVTRMVCVGTGEATSAAALELVEAMRRPDSPAVAEGVELWATVGLHPHDATEGVDSIVPLLDKAVGRRSDDGAPLVVAVGECGLDYHYDHSPRPIQREAFGRQVELARRLGLALVVHTREAWEDTVGILAEAGLPDRTVVHCFTGGPDEARRCLELGAWLSFSGVATFKNAADVREAAALCPLDRMLVETDAPFLAPVPHRGSVNEPARVALVGHLLAETKGVPIAELASRTTDNARAVFGL